MAFTKMGLVGLCLLFLSFNGCTSNEPKLGTRSLRENATQPWQEVVNYANEHLPQEGILKIKKDGFVYLKVDDNYIHALFPLLNLKDQGYKEPPYFRSPDAPGAHVSVFYENENVRPEEIGQVFKFELKDIIEVRAGRDASYAIFQIDAPELEALREKYGLASKLQGHEFHISIAKRKIPKDDRRRNKR